MNAPASAERFQQRSADYTRYRPGYPAPLLDAVSRVVGLTPGRVAADIGSGTGIFTRLLLDRGLRVQAVEPSADMRRAAETALGGRPGFVSVAGTADATTLPAHSIDVICCAQAFHWFNRQATRDEWQRIVRPGGHAVLAWNHQDYSSDFGQAYYELMLELGDGARDVIAASRRTAEDNVLFPGGAAQRIAHPNEQLLDFAGLVGRTASNSYMPKPGEPRYAGMVERLKPLFAAFARDGRVRLTYTTQAVFGTLQAA